jgi:hypothetical protein
MPRSTIGIRAAFVAGALAVLALVPACELPTGPEPPAALALVSVDPPSVVGGNVVQVVAMLSAAAPAPGVRIGLSSTDAAAPVPSGLVIAEGATSGSVSVTTLPVTANRSATVTGSYRGVSYSVALQITP